MSVPTNAPTNPPLEAAQALVDQRHPWLGLASFSEETRGFFYGREEEVAELARRVQRKLLTVLFGQSGLGKTSILRAGLVPRLRAEGYCPVYVRIDYGPDAPSAARQIKQAILRETAAAGTWSRAGVAAQDESLWEFFHHRDDVLHDPDGRALLPLLIFDQFEEIFTLAQGDDAGRRRAADFLDGLAELVENRPSAALEASLDDDDSVVERFDFARNDYRVLITLREDYLAHLESIKTQMPSITQNRMRLAPMTGRQALAAVTGPGGKLVSEEVAAAIVRFVAGGAELAHAQVEPSLLSLICRELNDKRIAAGRAEISLDLLAGSHASILSDFYARALLDQAESVRGVIEDVLLTESGYRENVAEERLLRALTAAAAAPDAASVLALLVNRRLLRIEERLDVRRVELTHDVLCGVVLASRALRHEREERAIAERKLAAQRERQRAIRKSLVRARQITAGCVVLSVVSVGSAVFGYIKMNQAQETRALAVESRAGAEKLVGYLLDDFYAELAPIGRLDMIGELAKRANGYYQELPAAMRTAETDANHARALVRLGDVQSKESKTAEADRTFVRAIALLEPIIAGGKAGETVRLVLADALLGRGEVALADGNFIVAIQLFGRSAAMAQPLALAPGASQAARLSYARARTRVGYIKMRADSDMDGSVIELNAARAVINNSAERQASIPLMIAYLKAGQWLQETMVRGEATDYAGAEVLAQDLLSGIGRVLQQRPNHLQAQSMRDAVQFMRGFFAIQQRKAGLALTIFTEAVTMQRETVRADPGNKFAVDALAIDLGWRGVVLANLGRPQDAAQSIEEVWRLYRDKPPSAYQATNLSGYAYVMATIHAQLGESAKLEQMVGRFRGFAQLQKSGKDSKQVRRMALMLDASELEWADIAGDTAATQARLRRLRLASEGLLAETQGSNQAMIEAQFVLLSAHRAAAHLAYAAGDYAQAEAESGQALKIYSPSMTDVTTRAVFRMEHALALARLRRLPEARVLLKLALDEQRAQIAAGADDQMLSLELAQSLYVSALTQPAAGGAELREAATLLARLPAAMQNYRTVRLWRGRVADEIRLNTRAGLAPGAAS